MPLPLGALPGNSYRRTATPEFIERQTVPYERTHHELAA